MVAIRAIGNPIGQKHTPRIVSWLTMLALGALWLGVVAIGTARLWQYELTPGKFGQAPVRWPSGSSLLRSDTLPTLLVFVHPRCPCSRSTLSELSSLIAKNVGKADTQVLFFRPDHPADPWDKTDLWHSAAAIQGVHVAWDEGGTESRRFGAATSGLALLYDTDGRLRFRGGITGSRGHEGGNLGRSAIESRLHGQTPATGESFVFGCNLLDNAKQEGTEL